LPKEEPVIIHGSYTLPRGDRDVDMMPEHDPKDKKKQSDQHHRIDKKRNNQKGAIAQQVGGQVPGNQYEPTAQVSQNDINNN
jgi:hypothetical protein